MEFFSDMEMLGTASFSFYNFLLTMMNSDKNIAITAYHVCLRTTITINSISLIEIQARKVACFIIEIRENR